MADAQCMEEEIPNHLEHQPVQMNTDNLAIAPDHPTPNLDQQNAALNPTVDLTRTDVDNIEEYIRRHSDIGLDWYVPNLSNTHVRDLNKTDYPSALGDARYYSTAPRILHDINL